MSLVRIAQTLTLLSLTWGTLAFGATYEWASRSLAVLAVVASLACLLASPHTRRLPRAVCLMMLGLLLAIGVQLVPLDQSTIAQLNPARQEALSQLWVAYRYNSALRHPLSINPPLTLWAGAFFGVACLWVIAVASLLATTGVRWLVRGLTYLGAALAIFGIVQNALYRGLVYGFWRPEAEFVTPFGPFINRNHFAGWMLMVVPLAIAWLATEVSDAASRVRSDWRSRLLWLLSEHGSKLALLILACGVMMLSVVATLSRSGVLALAASLLLSAVFLLGRRSRIMSRVVIAVVLLAVMSGLAIWVGPSLFKRLDTIRSAGTEDRLTMWLDAIDIGRNFWGFGTGLNSYGTMTLARPNLFKDLHVAQAHNDYLQLWVEGGLLLVLPAVLLVAAIVRESVRQFRRDSAPLLLRSAAVIGIVGVLLQETVDFSLQMPANFLLFATLVAMAIHVSRDATGRRRHVRSHSERVTAS